MSPGRILICGTGRSGTTLLVRILAEAGLDTGFTPEELQAAETTASRAGLERWVGPRGDKKLPQVVKSPHMVANLQRLFDEAWFKVGLAIIPVRELGAAAESRRRISAEAKAKGEDPDNTAGGLWGTTDPGKQEWILAEYFYLTVQPLVAAGVPIVFLDFPRFVSDGAYFVSTLGRALSELYGVTSTTLSEAHAGVADPSLVTVIAHP